MMPWPAKKNSRRARHATPVDAPAAIAWSLSRARTSSSARSMLALVASSLRSSATVSLPSFQTPLHYVVVVVVVVIVGCYGLLAVVCCLLLFSMAVSVVVAPVFLRSRV
jgi:hypothetical protein